MAGMTVNIGANVANFKQALNKVNRKIKESNRELLAYSKTLKSIDGKNIELLKDKYVAFSDKVQLLQNKLSELKKAQEKLEKMGVNNNHPFYRELKREIKETETALKSTVEESKKLNSTEGRTRENLRLKVEAYNQKIKETTDIIKENNRLVEGTKGIERISKLRSQYNLYSKAIFDTEDKLKALKAVEKSMKDQGFVKTEQANYKKLALEIRTATRELKELKKARQGSTTSGSILNTLDESLTRHQQQLEKLKGTSTKALLATGGGLFYGAKKAVEFEKAMTGVAKTVDPTNEELKKLSETAIQMSKTLPVTSTEIANTMMLAGQFGIKKDGIAEFAKTVIDLSNSTNILGEQGALSMAQFAGIVGMSADEYRRFGSTIVDLGNNSQAQEDAILELGQRLAGAGKMAKMSTASILGISTAIVSTGMNVEAGGTAMSKFIMKMETAVKSGNEQLGVFAKTAGMSKEEFKKLFNEDASRALLAVVDGMRKISDSGGDLNKTFTDLGSTDIRLVDTMKRLVNTNGELRGHLDRANNSWKENIALTKESSRYYATNASEFVIMKNKMEEASRKMGEKFLVGGRPLINMIDSIAEGFSNLDETSTITLTTLLVGMLGLSGGVIVLSSVITGIKTLTGAITALNVASLGLNLNPIVASLTLISSLIAGTTFLLNREESLKKASYEKSMKLSEERRQKLEEENRKFNEMVDKRARDIESKRRTLESEARIYSEKYSRHFEKMLEHDTVYQRHKENREKLDKQIYKMVEEIFNKKEKLTNKEIENIKRLDEEQKKALENELARLREKNKAYSVGAVNILKNSPKDIAEISKMSEGYTQKISETTKQSKEVLEKSHFATISLINEKHRNLGTIDSEAHQKEIDRATKFYNKRLEIEEREEAKSVYLVKKTSFEKILEKTNEKEKYEKIMGTIQTLNEKYISDTEQAYTHFRDNSSKTGELIIENHKKYQAGIKALLFDEKGLLKTNVAEHMGAFYDVLAIAKKKGVEITPEEKKFVDSIEKVYMKLEPSAKESFEKVFTTIKETTQENAPLVAWEARAVSLAFENQFAMMAGQVGDYVSNVFKTITSTIEREKDKPLGRMLGFAKDIMRVFPMAWLINSPSKKTQAYVSKGLLGGMIVGLDKSKGNVLKKTKQMADEVIGSFSKLEDFNSGMLNINPNEINRTKTVYTTPNITINTHTLSEGEMQRVYNELNRKFGGAYV